MSSKLHGLVWEGCAFTGMILSRHPDAVGNLNVRVDFNSNRGRGVHVQ